MYIFVFSGDPVKSSRKAKPHELTPEQEEEINTILNMTSNLPVVDTPRLKLNRDDLWTLRDGENVNDNIISCYLTMLMNRKRPQGSDLPRICKMSTFFYGRLKNSGYETVKKWAYSDIFAFDIIFVPIHSQEPKHWTLAVIDMTKNNESITYYDSCRGRDKGVLKTLLSYLEKEHISKKRTPMKIKFKLEVCKHLPTQTTVVDCGPFMLNYAYCISRRKDFNFDQNDIPFIRKRIFFEILNGKFLDDITNPHV